MNHSGAVEFDTAVYDGKHEWPAKGKRHPLNMRTTKELRESIEAAAFKSGRSMTQEVEFRLEQSFQKTEIETINRTLQKIAKKLGIE